MRAALIAIAVWLAVSIPSAVAFGHFLAGQPLNNNRRIRKPVAPRSRPAWRILGGCLIACLMLAACGGGSGSADPAPTPPTSVASSPPPPPTSLPTGPGEFSAQCSSIGATGTFPSCICPSGLQYVGGSTTAIGQCVVVPPAPPYGTPTPPPTTQCPPGDLPQNGVCVTPPPPAMLLQASASTITAGQAATLTWSSTNASGCIGASNWPPPTQLQPSGSINVTPTATEVYTLVCDGVGGNAEQSVQIVVVTAPVPPVDPCTIAQEAVCNPTTPPVLTETLSLSSPTVVDDSAGCPDPMGNPCVSSVSIQVSSTFPGDNTSGSILCYVPPATVAQYLTSAPQMGPYPAAQDGPQVMTVACSDPYGATSSASVTLNVVPPSVPPPPTFACVLNSGAVNCTWWTPDTGPGCAVELYSGGSGPYAAGVALTPNGTTSGTASSAALSSAYDPYTAVLQCPIGTPLVGVPNIVFSP